MKKALLIGNHSCSNRGDAAILRGLIEAIDTTSISIDIASRDPATGEIVLEETGLPVIQDVFEQARHKLMQGSFYTRKVMSRYLNGIMYASSKYNWSVEKTRKLLPRAYNEAIDTLAAYDYIIQVGGSFIVDAYGFTQLDIIFGAKMAGRKVYLIGHSVGPFEHKQFRELCQNLLPYPETIVLREHVSEDILKKAGIYLDNLGYGADTAWLMPESQHVDLTVINPDNKPMVGITARRLAPFDSVLGVSQEAYEQQMASTCDTLVEKGHMIIGVSTCTGLNGYHRDDRLTLHSIKKRMRHPEGLHIIFDELSDLQIGGVLSQCRFTIATRLHSGIISMRYGTPALVIAYEHKSEGILTDMALNAFSLSMQEFVEGETLSRLETLEADYDQFCQLIGQRVEEHADMARQHIRAIFSE
ncbi:polysaccharide pyruvyl transferase family protein [Larsenimonas rhizosphaerae]|uniref:Polysaccharide pyruvyl transferase family protein n=1 Tax=Larsenimonas rhizosphaerae TaxID=2944682 RepID=A0AA41ZN05_9GAMM|nr:polysaccharide pyruvyl transferase family protein [Larsenimonas rhizosphaerae]MCM2131185.1 polysaccharide pyruvyl transferase family protein [Larsenimonas rhizosphaerae]MCX2523890.1 polysaccharide pyruvyl transferase family protein [Larsenimonas rhizosphaerae]